VNVSGVVPLAMTLAVLGCLPSQGLAQSPGGIGVLGDSYSDEYQFYPPDRATARNWVEILSATRGLDFGQFSPTTRGEPRNQGYEFNWARSDATTDDLLRTGQHTGLAAQIARGEVSVAVVFIGGNDFINALKSPDPLPTLERVLPQALANFRTAVATLRAADPKAKLVLATVPDIRHLPEFAGPIRAGTIPAKVADAFTTAIARYNAQIRALAAGDPASALLDLDRATLLADLISRDYVTAAGRKLDRNRPGNDPDRFFLADSRHPGTLGQALMASMFIEVVNARFDARIRPLTCAEVIRLADRQPVLASSSSPNPGPAPALASPVRPTP
jgi:phospholipase/lecithinase/hemolysin